MTTGFDPAFLDTTSNSFVNFVARVAPEVLPGTRAHAPGAAREIDAPQGTTIVALNFAGGVLMAGDRRATIGNLIASQRIKKVHPADSTSVVGIAGAAGLALELVRLFQLELEHYEKIEGTPLSLEGKANRLAAMLRGNLSLALNGLAVVPLFAGVTPGSADGAIYSFDVTGGKYREADFHAIGSGSGFARGSLKKLWQPGLDQAAAVRTGLEALIDAADDDSATGGPDLMRKIAPQVVAVDGAGVHPVPSAEVLAATHDIISQRGPQ